MRIALKSALMLATRVIQIINPELHLHMQRTALIALELALAAGLSRQQQQTIFCAALLHDIGVLGDKRVIASLNAIDNLDDPHQHRGAEMLDGLATLAPILPIIRDHHFSPSHRGSLEQHIVYFADVFERLLSSDKTATIYQTDIVIDKFRALYQEIDPQLCQTLCQLAQKEHFWLHLNPGHIQRMLEIIGPINAIYIDIDGLKDICLLIAKIVDTYSSFTASHSLMVGKISRMLATYINLPELECQKIEIAGYLHDIGKIYIPLAILEKQGELDDEELLQVREHSYMTGKLLSAFSELGEIINWAANHHEKLDGSGYPLHLNEDYLQLPDRIIAIADIFTALTEDRPYRHGMNLQQALQLIEADVINGALDKDVYRVLHQHAKALHAIITNTLHS
ncbi:HD domain-containing protein [Klebsiella sp. RHBSTW-00484]|uniref:HD-GYP domain-containing protein n=1 Tax=unclassified Klebsiella TaxID=2608929 RepID=UPI0015E50703|nr:MULTISPECIES: HD domain-containing phosphohydrolase [unclassified Klebsiella]MBA7846684.1 HD domain-containing protein [Klebsiella sp. RHBSTW-00465]QLO37438.1 HD domain-containing protein [Klebsiella sp. RHBSTW-00484]QLT76956.1 HD domain-containing protein [Klebsiella sp. RHBSTW-00464]